MHKRKLIVFTILLVVSLTYGSEKPLIDTEQLTNMVNLIEATNSFAVDIFQKVAIGTYGNICISPFSLANALGLLYYGSGSETAQELDAALYYDEYNLTRSGLSLAFYNLIKVFLVSNNQDMYMFDSASTLLVDKSIQVSPSFQQQAEVFFQAPISVVDFSQKVHEVVLSINQWVSERTQRRINTIIDDIDPSNHIMLLNAVSFKGAWWYTFKAHMNTEEIFYNASPLRPNQVTMMHQIYDFPYHRNENRSLVELPFKGKNMSMVFLLPERPDGLSDIEQELTLSTLKEDIASMDPTWVEVIIPKFRFEFEMDAKELLESLGVQRLFNPRLVDLTAMAGDNVGPVVGEIRHKTVMSVTESGVEASAVTAMVTLKSMNDGKFTTPEFRADHPFLFFILDKRTEMILFMGRVDSL